MASLFEDIALYSFAHETLIKPVRRNMKQHVLSKIDPTGELRDGDEFIAELTSLRRTPDAVAVLEPADAIKYGLEEKQTVLFIEAEHSSPLTEDAITEYTDLWMNADDMGSDLQIAVVIVERYGRTEWLDLGALSFARHIRNGLDFDMALESLRIERSGKELSAAEVAARLQSTTTATEQ